MLKDYSEASESLYETDSAVGDEDDGPKLGGRGNLSVKDAISLFEVKRRVLWIQPRQGYQSKGVAGIPLTMWVHYNSGIYYVIWFIWMDNNMCKYMVAHDKLPTHNWVIAALKGLPCFEVPLPGWPRCGTSKHGRAERATIIQHRMTQA